MTTFIALQSGHVKEDGSYSGYAFTTANTNPFETQADDWDLKVVDFRAGALSDTDQIIFIDDAQLSCYVVKQPEHEEDPYDPYYDNDPVADFAPRPSQRLSEVLKDMKRK